MVVLRYAGEAIGFDKKLKVNTVKIRAHSLFTQGQFYYEVFNNFNPLEQQQLIEQFNRLLQNQHFWYCFLYDQNLEGQA